MNKIILFALWLCLIGVVYKAHAASYMVYQFTKEVRIVLSQMPCKAPNKGLQAAAQRIDNASISGCWVPEGRDMIRITWTNNDFAVFREKDFTPVQE